MSKEMREELDSRIGNVIGAFQHLFSSERNKQIKCNFYVTARVRTL